MITSQLVQDFWAFMCKRFSSKVVQKDESRVMGVAAELLNVLDIQDKDQFMKNFVTTLYCTIYVPFEIGISDSHWDLWDQIRVCVHEHQHIVQGNREGWMTFGSHYLTSSSFRAGYEVEAYGCDLELEFYRTGKVIDIDARASSLKSYGCSESDIEMVKSMLTIRAGVVSQGVVTNISSAVAIEWLDAYAGSLREHV